MFPPVVAPAPAVELIRSLVAASSRTSREAADFTPAHLDEVCRVLGVPPASPATVGPLLRASVDALAADRASGSPTANSRCWSQWFFRMGGRVTHVGCTEIPVLVAAIDEALATLPSPSPSMPWLITDVKASVAGALAWELLDIPGAAEQVALSDGEFVELFTLYTHQLHFDAEAIGDFLAGHPDSRSNPVKMAFGFFGQSVIGDQAKALAILQGHELGDHALPLAAAKLIAYVLHAAPPQRSSYLDTDALPEEVLGAFATALSVWRAHGGGVQFFTAQAGYAALVNDPAGVVLSINNAVRILSGTGRVASSEFLTLIRLRSDMLERVRVARELQGVRALRADADHALAVAKESSTQIPTIVGLFAAVIALVIGSSQLAQGMPARSRILVVAALGTVLLTFVVALAGIVRFMAGTRVSVGRLGLFMVGAAGAAGLILALLYWTAG